MSAHSGKVSLSISVLFAGHLQISDLSVALQQLDQKENHGEGVRSKPANEEMVDTLTNQSSIAINCQFEQQLNYR